MSLLSQHHQRTGTHQNRPCFPVARFVLVLLLATSLFSCKKTERIPQTISIKGDAAKQAGNGTGIEKYEVSPLTDEEYHALKNGESQPCTRDTDCALYLHCRNSKCEVPPAITGNTHPETPRLTFRHGDQSRASFFLEIASEEHQMVRGLMYRRSMKPNWGMLFVYPNEKPRSFWMKNTFIPLDMLFIAADGTVVGIIEHAEPLTRTLRAVDAPARYVLELNAGTAQSRGIQVGDKMSLENAKTQFLPTKD